LKEGKCDGFSIVPKNNPLMRSLTLPSEGLHLHEELARIAACCSIHMCLAKNCGGIHPSGKGCRFNFPRQTLQRTILYSHKASNDFCETTLILKSSNNRIANLNKFHLLAWRGNVDGQPLINFGQAVGYVAKYATKGPQHTELVNKVLCDIHAQRDSALTHSLWSNVFKFFSVSNQYRSDLTVHELMYNALSLPFTYSSIVCDVLAYYARSKIEVETVSEGQAHILSLTDKTLYTAYAERHNNNSIWKCHIGIEDISLYEFALYCCSHNWTSVVDNIVKKTTKRNRNPNELGYFWSFKFTLTRRKHFRLLKFIECDFVESYLPFFQLNMGKKEFTSLEREHRMLLSKAYEELVLFHPWMNDPDQTFVPNAYFVENGIVNLKMKYEAYFKKYMHLLKQGKVAPANSEWQRWKIFARSLYQSNCVHNSAVSRRVGDSTLVPLLAENNNEEDLQEIKDCNLAGETGSGIEFECYEGMQDTMESEIISHINKMPPPTADNIHLPNSNSAFWTERKHFIECEMEPAFLAKPDGSSILRCQLSAGQLFAVNLITNLVCRFDKLDADEKILYIIGEAGTGKSAIVNCVYDELKGQHVMQICSANAKAASIFNAPTFHGAFGLHLFNSRSGLGEKKKKELQVLYNVGLKNECKIFFVDEVNALSADLIFRCHSHLNIIFPTKNNETQVCGSRIIIFIGDPAQLPPIKSCSFMDYDKLPQLHRKPLNQRGIDGRSRVQQGKIILYKNLMKKNVICLEKIHRNHGLLPDIMQRLRYGKQTKDDWVKITYLANKFPENNYDIGLYINNYSRFIENNNYILTHYLKFH
jgi:hypothetical protein